VFVETVASLVDGFVQLEDVRPTPLDGRVASAVCADDDVFSPGELCLLHAAPPRRSSLDQPMDHAPEIRHTAASSASRCGVDANCPQAVELAIA
jgi:hypothetical protein